MNVEALLVNSSNQTLSLLQVALPLQNTADLLVAATGKVL